MRESLAVMNCVNHGASVSSYQAAIPSVCAFDGQCVCVSPDQVLVDWQDINCENEKRSLSSSHSKLNQTYAMESLLSVYWIREISSSGNNYYERVMTSFHSVYEHETIACLAKAR